FSGGYNAGAQASTGEVVILLNSDLEIGPGAIETLTAAAREPGVGVVGCRLTYPDGRLQHGGFGFVGLEGRPPHPYHMFWNEPGDLPAARSTYELQVVTRAVLALRRGGFDAVRRLDPGVPSGRGDARLLR